MAEFHKMATVITGLGQCFKQENSDCELENRNTHYINCFYMYTCTLYVYCMILLIGILSVILLTRERESVFTCNMLYKTYMYMYMV